MTTDTPGTPGTPSTTDAPLPPAVERYLAVVGDRTGADDAELFTDDAVVTDDGSTHRGRSEVRAWLTGPAARLTVVHTVLSTQVEDRRTTVVGRLDGDFPGATVTLRHRFDLADDGRIAVLEIRPTT